MTCANCAPNRSEIPIHAALTAAAAAFQLILQYSEQEHVHQQIDLSPVGARVALKAETREGAVGCVYTTTLW